MIALPSPPLKPFQYIRLGEQLSGNNNTQARPILPCRALPCPAQCSPMARPEVPHGQCYRSATARDMGLGVEEGGGGAVNHVDTFT